MTVHSPVQGGHTYKTQIGVSERRADGVKIVTPMLFPDDEGIDSTNEDNRIARDIRSGSLSLLAAIARSHG